MSETNDNVEPRPGRQRGKEHPPDVKAEAAGLFLQGNTASYVAKKLDIPLNTAKVWRRETISDITSEMRREWAAQIEENLYRTIIMSQAAMLAQLEVMSDPTWIKQQTASDLATLHGITHDKVIRLLEATGQGQEIDKQVDEGPVGSSEIITE